MATRVVPFCCEATTLQVSAAASSTGAASAAAMTTADGDPASDGSAGRCATAHATAAGGALGMSRSDTPAGAAGPAFVPVSSTLQRA